VTNGNIKRQSNKIKYLGISRYFKKIFILDGINKMVKPSIKDVIFLSKFIKKNKCLKSVYVGDNIISDKKFARNLKIPFIYYQFPY
jgi:FMN phosphatase YigB (HAD superfamily)